ncbi:MAG: hypothetical protein PVH88_02205 [Ignavibacteria bacterium]|jgi:hypothetical protein
MSTINRGIRLSFREMFSQPFGMMIILMNNQLALNIYACAGQESSFYTGCVGDNGKSYGLFQFYTSVHKEKDISKYINKSIRFFKLEFLENLNYSEWVHSVGYKMVYPKIEADEINIDVQIAAWLGYMIEENYISELANISVFTDIVNYQKAQRFHPDHIDTYQKNTEKYYNIAKEKYDKYYSELKKVESYLIKPFKMKSTLQ